MKTKLVVLAMIALVPTALQAGEKCLTDADCPEGFYCLVLPCACECPPCPDGEECECPPCDCFEGGECVEIDDDPFDDVIGGECETDADCPDGFYCVGVGMPCVCECPPCPEGEECECPPCDCPKGECIEMEDDSFDDVIAGECETDADCPIGFVCEEMLLPCPEPECPVCVCPQCDPDDPECDPDACECPDCEDVPSDCLHEPVKVCVFSPQECSEDSDCPEGFECQQFEKCSGGGSKECVCPVCACPECLPGEECPPCACPEEPEPCECEEDGSEEECVVVSICAPQEVPCETNTDCPEGFECVGSDVESTCLPVGWDDVTTLEGEPVSGDIEKAIYAEYMEDSGKMEGTKKNAEAPLNPESEGVQSAGDKSSGAGQSDSSENGSIACSASPIGSSSVTLLLVFALGLTLFLRREAVPKR